MKHILFHKPEINPEFHDRLKNQVILEYEKHYKSKNRFNFIMSFSLSVISIMLLVVILNSPYFTSYRNAKKLDNIDKELLLIEQDLINDTDITSAIDFENL